MSNTDNKSKSAATPLRRLIVYFLTLIGSSTVFYGAVFATAGWIGTVWGIICSVILLFCAFTAFIFAGALKKQGRKTASSVSYCFTMLFNNLSGAILLVALYSLLGVEPDVIHALICVGAMIAISLIAALISALTKHRLPSWIMLSIAAVLLALVIRQLVLSQFKSAFYLMAGYTLMISLFKLILSAGIVGGKNYLRYDALLSFGIAIAIGTVALIIFSDGEPVEALTTVGGRDVAKKSISKD